MYQKGTATDYRDVLNKLDLFITSRHVSAAAINAAGTGYVVGDILTVAGGTVAGSMEAKVEVLTVDTGGEVLTLRVYESGAYTADPTTTANAVTGGTGSSATVDLTMHAAMWTQRLKEVYAIPDFARVSGGTIGVDGAGYAVDDIVTLADVITSTTKAQFKVTAVSGSGDVLNIELYDGGSYNSEWSGTVGVTGGTGSGLTIAVSTTSNLDFYLWEGEGTGGNSVYAGAKTLYTGSISQPYISLRGFSGYISGSDFESQPGSNPGHALMPGSTGSMPFWFYVSARRIIIVFQAAGAYISGHIGLLDPFGTDTEIPYPMYVCGTTDNEGIALGAAPLYFRSIADPTASNSSVNGPGFFRDGAATWQVVWTGYYSSGIITGTTVSGYTMYPCGKSATAGLNDEDDYIYGGLTVFETFIPNNRTSTPDCLLMPSPDSGGAEYLPIPCVVVRGSSSSSTAHRVIGEVSGLFWICSAGILATEDRLVCSDRYFRVFQMGPNSLPYAFFCVEEV